MKDNESEKWEIDIGRLNIRSNDVVILGGTVLIIILLGLCTIIYFAWRCCCRSTRDPGASSSEIAEGKDVNTQSYSAVFLGAKNNKNEHTSRVVEVIPQQESSDVQWLYNNHRLVFISDETASNMHQPYSVNSDKSPQGVYKRDMDLKLDEHLKEGTPNRAISIWSTAASIPDCSLPEISEFSANPCKFVSNNILEECYSSNENYKDLKTRSLPSCVRQKKRPSSAIDCSSEFYDKVNFSKKKKNRMRNDDAAIIAISRSRSGFFDDTDILVDNEAVIVYDERTAL